MRSYKNLSRVERVFRCLKGIDVLLRSIRHREERRDETHIFLCMLAYYVEWHMRKALKKRTRCKTTDSLVVHSFETLLAELATRCLHKCRLKSDPDGPSFQPLPEPTARQQRALQLLKMCPVAGTPPS